MAKGVFDIGGTSQGHRSGPDSAGDSSRRPSPLTSRMSVLTSVKIPILRRLDLGNSAQTNKTPLLTLKLSSQSFLDCTLRDDFSSRPLYTICTSACTTTITRTDASERASKLAELKWPRIIPSRGKCNLDRILVQLKGSRWKGGDLILKPSTSRSGSQKFNIPHYPHTMKWERRGKSFWCTTPPVKGPIAILEQSANDQSGSLTVYETLHDKYETSPMEVYHGVSIFLLDYLLVTAILLVTDVQEWMVVQSVGAENSGNDSNSNTAQWRKIMFGEALYPKNFHLNHTSGGTSGPNPDNNNTSMSHYPVQRVPSPQPSFLSDSSEKEDDDDTYQSTSGLTQKTQSPSFSSDSIPYSSTKSAPSHTFVDPSYYQYQPPAPPGPSRYTTQARSTSPISTRSRRVLPTPPVAPVELPVPSGSRPAPARSRSEPQRDTQSHSRADYSNTTAPADPSLWGLPSPTLNRTRSMSRPLPRTPGVSGTAPHDPVVRRVRSQARIDREKPLWASTPPPPLPPLPPLGTPRTSTRSLPRTPLDVAMGRPGGGNPLASESIQQIRKSFDSDEEWHNLVPSKPSFDQPPPAYSSIDHSHS